MDFGQPVLKWRVSSRLFQTQPVLSAWSCQLESELNWWHHYQQIMTCCFPLLLGYNRPADGARCPWGVRAEACSSSREMHSDESMCTLNRDARTAEQPRQRWNPVTFHLTPQLLWAFGLNTRYLDIWGVTSVKSNKTHNGFTNQTENQLFFLKWPVFFSSVDLIFILWSQREAELIHFHHFPPWFIHSSPVTEAQTDGQWCHI